MGRFDIALNKSKPFKFFKSHKKDRAGSNPINRALKELNGVLGHGLPSPQRSTEIIGDIAVPTEISGETGIDFGDTGISGETGIQPAGFWPGSTGVWFSDTGIQPVESMRHNEPPVFSLEREFEENALEEERAFEEVAETMLSMNVPAIIHNPAYPSAVAHSGDAVTSQGPTSRHLMIAGPDGHRVLIPLRILDYSINGNTLVVRLPDGQASALQSDIQAGIQRQQEVDNNRYG